MGDFIVPTRVLKALEVNVCQRIEAILLHAFTATQIDPMLLLSSFPKLRVIRIELTMGITNAAHRNERRRELDKAI
jgi:hypothetical protein